MNPARILSSGIATAALFLGCGWTDDDPNGPPAPPATPQSAIDVGAATDSDVYVAFDFGIAVFENFGPATVHLSACSPSTLERRLDGRWSEVQLSRVQCIGPLPFATRLEEGEFVESDFVAPPDSGLYRFRYFYGTDCEDGLPLFFANCTRTPSITTNEFEVVRELCEGTDPGCRVRPGTPTLLCRDGVNLSGPSRECTLDPTTLECGYEMLSCP